MTFFFLETHEGARNGVLPWGSRWFPAAQRVTAKMSARADHELEIQRKNNKTGHKIVSKQVQCAIKQVQPFTKSIIVLTYLWSQVSFYQ